VDTGSRKENATSQEREHFRDPKERENALGSIIKVTNGFRSSQLLALE
jgi:hypothetical protein